MPSLHHRSIAIKNITTAMLMLLLTTLCPKRCRGLQIFRSSKIGRTSQHHHYGDIRSVTSSSLRHGISTVVTACSPHSNHRGCQRISKYPHHKASLIKLYSQNNSSPSDDDVTTTRAIEKAATSSFLKQHLAQLEYDGKLCSEEVTSINDSLLNLLQDETAFHHHNTAVSNVTHVLQTSIELFMAQKESRLGLNTRPIENVGGYVRAIVRNQLNKSSNSVGQHRVDVDAAKQQGHHVGGRSNQFDGALNQQQKQQPQQVQHQEQQPNISSKNDNQSIHTLLQPFIQRSQLNQNELNESCLQTLSQTSIDMAQYALEAYVRQKQRRLAKDMAPILDPSSYVLKILR